MSYGSIITRGMCAASVPAGTTDTILAYVHAHPECTISDIVADTDVRLTSAKYAISRLCLHDRLIRTHVDGNRYTYRIPRHGEVISSAEYHRAIVLAEQLESGGWWNRAARQWLTVLSLASIDEQREIAAWRRAYCYSRVSALIKKPEVA